MDIYPTLRDLVECDPASRQLFGRLPPDAQVALQEQRQDIHTFEELQKAARFKG